MHGGMVATDLTRSFGTKTALDHVSLTVAEGEIAALMGHNGAGKSTLLRIFSTVLLPDSGTAAVAGHDVREFPHAVRQRISVVVTDDRSWALRAPARVNLEFHAGLRGLSLRRARPLVEELITAVGLADDAQRPVRTFSTGMRHRLAIARALLAVGPAALLLDEPTRSLDDQGTGMVHERVRALAAAGTSVLLVTHDAAEATALEARVVSLDHGRTA